MISYGDLHVTRWIHSDANFEEFEFRGRQWVSSRQYTSRTLQRNAIEKIKIKLEKNKTICNNIIKNKKEKLDKTYSSYLFSNDGVSSWLGT